MHTGEFLGLKGRVDIFTTQGRPRLISGKPIDFSGCNILSSETYYNIILNAGKRAIINSLSTGSIKSITRMAIGDGGALIEDQTSPRIPTSNRDGLYREVIRGDLYQEGTSNVEIDSSGLSIKFTKTFDSKVIDQSLFSDPIEPIVNEVGLIATTPPENPETDGRRDNGNGVDVADDEEVFTLRTFKSVPFERTNGINITIRYTLSIE